MIKLAGTIKGQLNGIAKAIADRRSNAYAEALNGIIQSAKSRARGYATSINMIAIIYLVAGKLSLLPRNPMRYAT